MKKRTTCFGYSCAAVVAFCLATELHAHDVLIRVRDPATDRPLVDVPVAIPEAGRKVFTNENGEVLTDLPQPGQYTFRLIIGDRIIDTRIDIQEEVTEVTIPDASVGAVGAPGIEVVGRWSLIGTARSAGEGSVRQDEIEARPLLRTGELAEFVPGMIATQHSGAGKANQYFLRGFNLDHGTDFATRVDGVPVNLPTHGHGQGYTDTGFLIPELVERIDYKKGVYYADEGDFASAGAVNYVYANRVDKPMVRIEGGNHGYGRVLGLGSVELGPGDFLYAAEGMHEDGPWTLKNDYRKVNGVFGYHAGTRGDGIGVKVSGNRSTWNATDQVPQRALERGRHWLLPDNDGLGRYDAVDESDGGGTARAAVTVNAVTSDRNSELRLMLYGVYYELDLYSNFTYYLDDPERGDQFEQTDRRTIAGTRAQYRVLTGMIGFPTETSAGFEYRRDFINNGLYHTYRRTRLETQRRDQVLQSTGSGWVESQTRWSNWFRTILGVRGDLYFFHVEDERSPFEDLLAESEAEDDETEETPEDADALLAEIVALRESELPRRFTDSIASPKGGVVFGPWFDTELYGNYGYGFHSNDARGLIDRTNPVDPLVRTRGGEVGVRSEIADRWRTSASLWRLDLDSELVFVGDAGTTEANRPSTRWGAEWSNRIRILPWLSLDADFAYSRARFRDDDPAGRHVPGAIELAHTGGLVVEDLHGFFGAARVRYFGRRDLTEDGSIRSPPSTLLNLEAGYQHGESWSLAFQVFNVLNTKVGDIDYYYASRLRNEPEGPDDGGYNDVHTHPAEPRSARVVFTAWF